MGGVRDRGCGHAVREGSGMEGVGGDRWRVWEGSGMEGVGGARNGGCGRGQGWRV